ncbi:recombination directionality factor, partial [Corallococcus praedator]|uniref:recombination directionality factor n=1 Tax=Corallococcus praedator TaxID=2316724 RepID=UPI001ABF8B9C
TKLVHLGDVPDIAQRTEEFLRQGLPPDKAKLINWQPTLYLRFMIRDFPMVGYWQISTHGGQSSIPQITGVVDTWKGLLGSLCLVPFVLVIKRGKSADKAKQFSYLNLLPAFSLEQARQSALGRDGSLTLNTATHSPTALATEPVVTLLSAGEEVADA